MKSRRGVPLWLDREPMVSFDRISNDMNIDVAIIGAGIEVRAAQVIEQVS